MSRLERLHWKNKTRDVRAYRSGCHTCQQKNDSIGRTLQDPSPLELPELRWGLIATAFIIELPKTRSVFDVITTVVARLARRVHFTGSNTSDTAEDVAVLF